MTFTSIENKDSLVIRRSFSLKQIKEVIKGIDVLETNTDKFTLGYFIPATKRNLKNADLFVTLIDTLLDGNYDAVALVGDEYATYYSAAHEYQVVTESGDIFLVDEQPITTERLFSELKARRGKLSKTFVEKVLKDWKIRTYDDSGGPILYPISISDAVQGQIEHGADKTPCYLLNGTWYVFDPNFEKDLDRDFADLCAIQNPLAEYIKNSFLPTAQHLTEQSYNDALYDINNIVVAHEALMWKVEIADCIFWDNEGLYLMHNKGKFGGIGARDLTNQIATAAELVHKALNSPDRRRFLEEYYLKIEERYRERGNTLSLSKDDFIENFTTKPITFIAAYVNSFSPNSGSNYAKYLSISLEKRLAANSYSCISMAL